MNEAALITRMIQLGSVLRYEHLVRTELLSSANREIFEFLTIYERQHGLCMDEPSFRGQFESFAWTPTEYQVEFLADALREQHLAAQVEKLLEDTKTVVEDDPAFVARQLTSELQKLTTKFGGRKKPAEIFAKMRSRRDYFESRRITVGLSGITLGFDHFDEWTHGTQPGEIEIWCGRTANCKTFSLLWSAFQARLQGKRVSVISPEMREMSIGMRLDAMALQMSQSRLKSGHADDDFFRIYDEAMAEMQLKLQDVAGCIIVHEAFSNGRQFNVNDIRTIIDNDEPDIVIIDGLGLITPMQAGRSIYENVSNVMAEFRQLTNATNIPLRMAHQASRESERNTTGKRKKELTPADKIPDLAHLSDSSFTEKFADRVICTYYDKEAKRIYYAVRKDREADTGEVIFTYVDIDTGTVSKSHIYEEEDAQMPFEEKAENVF